MNMMNLTGIPRLGEIALPSGQGKDSPGSRHEAASQFEALLIGQLMQSMRASSGSGWLDTGEDQAGSAMGDFAEQHLSQVIAQQGGFGLASLVEQGLAHNAKANQKSQPAVTPL